MTVSRVHKPGGIAVRTGSGIRGILLLQFLLVAVVSGALLAFYGFWPAVSAGYGGGAAGVNAWLLERCAQRDARDTGRTPGQSLTAVYICVVQRFLVVALLFGAGMGALKLNPPALLAGFIVGQLVMVISGTRQLKQN